jgi:hypothetical protein
VSAGLVDRRQLDVIQRDTPRSAGFYRLVRAMHEHGIKPDDATLRALARFVIHWPTADQAANTPVSFESDTTAHPNASRRETAHNADTPGVCFSESEPGRDTASQASSPQRARKVGP